jgi:hypothetical protein
MSCLRILSLALRSVILAGLLVVPVGLLNASDIQQVNGTVKSADPKTGVVVVDTDDGEMTIQTTPKTANFGLIVEGKTFTIRVKDTKNGKVAISVAVAKEVKGNSKKAVGPAPAKGGIDKHRYGLDPVIVGNASVRSNAKLLKELAEIDVSELIRFQSTKVEFERRQTGTLVSSEGLLHPNRSVWKKVAPRLRAIFEQLSSMKFEDIQTFERQDRYIPTAAETPRTFVESLSFWQRFDRALKHIPVPGQPEFPFGNVSMIPVFGAQYQDSGFRFVKTGRSRTRYTQFCELGCLSPEF